MIRGSEQSCSKQSLDILRVVQQDLRCHDHVTGIGYSIELGS